MTSACVLNFMTSCARTANTYSQLIQDKEMSYIWQWQQLSVDLSY